MAEKVNIYKFIWKFARRHKISISILLIFSTIHELAGVIITPYLNRNLINEASSINPSFKIGLIYIVAYSVVSSLVHIFNSLFFKIRFSAVNKVQKEMGEDMFYYTTKHSMNYFNNSFSGSLNSRINSVAKETGIVINVLIESITIIVIAVSSLIIYVGISIPIALCFVFIFTVYFLAMLHTKKSINETAKELSEAKSEFFGLINDDFTNITNIKFFSNEKMEIESARKSSDRIDYSNYKVLKAVANLNMASFILSFIFIFSILSIGGYLLMNHRIKIGDFMFIMILSSILRFALELMTDNMSIFIESKGKMENNIASIMKPLEIKNRENVGNLKISTGKIIFKNISFSYGGTNV